MMNPGHETNNDSEVDKKGEQEHRMNIILLYREASTVCVISV